jgi:predicted ATP-grasp superfamily ATP-dependent carboligase
LIVGASARAAAQSAMRAGFAPAAADMFADSDLRALCPAVRIADYPRGLRSAASKLPKSAWIYTGGVENHPRLVDALACDRPLLGNPGHVLRRVRNPWRVRDALKGAGLPFAEVLPPGDSPTTGRWLEKPLHASGGRGIAHFEQNSQRPPAGRYLQELIAGESQSAIFIGARGKAMLLGTTRQLIGADWLAAGPFAYCGSIGPLALNDSQTGSWTRIGERLAEEFQLSGLFGVDAVVAGERITPVEVNPRYTASVEIIERGAGIAALRRHADACRGKALGVAATPNGVFGKAIVFARRTGVADQRMHDRLRRDACPEWPSVADVPAAGERIEAGWPLVTVFAEGDSPPEVEAELLAMSRAVYDSFESP